MKGKVITLILTAVISMSASAEPLADYDALYDDCLEQASAINNSVVMMCANEVSTLANSEVKRRYQSIYAYLLSENAQDAAQFSASQKAWRNYRNTHCQLAGAYVGSPMYEYCPMNLNAARALDLRAFAQNDD